MRDFEFLTKLIHLLIAKEGSIVSYQDIRNPEAENDMLLNEGSYCLSRGSN